MLKEEAHSQKMADAAVGLGSDRGQNQRLQNEDHTEAMKDVEG
jgi:hypothetical protein